MTKIKKNVSFVKKCVKVKKIFVYLGYFKVFINKKTFKAYGKEF